MVSNRHFWALVHRLFALGCVVAAGACTGTLPMADPSAPGEPTQVQTSPNNPSEAAPGQEQIPDHPGAPGSDDSAGVSTSPGEDPSASQEGASGTGSSSSTTGNGQPTEAGLRNFLSEFVVGAAHEGIPHGVPPGYDWYDRAVGATLTPPNGEAVANWWGVVYADASNTRAANTRIAVANGRFLVLYQGSGTWQTVQATNALGGGSWAEDFHSTCGKIDLRTDPDGSRSIGPSDVGCNSHIWPDLAFADVDERNIRAVLVVAHTRVVMSDPSGPDNRASSTSLLDVGADWRTPDGSCPIPQGSSVDVCTSFGVGKFIRPTPEWRTVVFHSMTIAELQTLPMPPLDPFRMPDGTALR